MDESDERDERLPHHPQAEGVRIIRAEEAQAALDAGQAAGRRPEDEPRFGDVPPPPSGPRSPHRFPLPDSVDPASAVPRPPVRPPERRFGGRLSRAKAPEPVRAPAPPRVVRLVAPSVNDGNQPGGPATEQISATGDGGWNDPQGWSEDVVPRPMAAEPLTVGAAVGPKHFAKDPDRPATSEPASLKSEFPVPTAVSCFRTIACFPG